MRRRALLWLLAVLLPLHGLVAASLSTLGPAHTHKPVARQQATANVLGAFGHFHASAAPRHHHHHLGDASVQRTGDEAMDADAATPALAAIVAVLPADAGWAMPRPARAAVAAYRPWAFVTHHPDLPDKPPRRA